jgi:precorrin-6B methylase 2
MKTKQLIATAMGLSLVAGFAFTLPALADTSAEVSVGANVGTNLEVNTDANASANTHGGWQGQGEGGMQHGKPAIVGTVSTINGTTLTISGRNGFMPDRTASTSTATIFTVDASNAKVVKGNASSTVSGISVGDVVVVQGTVSGTNVTATMIRDGQMPKPHKNGGDNTQSAMAMLQGNGQPVIAGTISVISGSTLTVTNKSNVTYSVDTSNAKILAGQTVATLSSLKIGDAVVIQGAINGTSVTASTVIDQATPTSDNGGQPHRKSFFGSIGQFFSHLFGF